MSVPSKLRVSVRLGVPAAAGLVSLAVVQGTTGDDPVLQGRPEVLELTGIVRDFQERWVPSGHPDFERRPDLGFGRYVGNVAPYLGPDFKPVFTGAGHQLISEWRDSEDRPICYTLFDPALGDQAGVVGPVDTGGIVSAETFNQWFRDSPGKNLSAVLRIELIRQPDGTYVFDDKDDPLYSSLGGFFPIEDQLFGNPGGFPDRNFHFTFELRGTFVYDAMGQQIFRFTGDDDVWVYIDGRLVIDLGGVHEAVDQIVDLNRLRLEHGRTYRLDFFFAERHRTQSNFRITTNLELKCDTVPSITAAFD